MTCGTMVSLRTGLCSSGGVANCTAVEGSAFLTRSVVGSRRAEIPQNVSYFAQQQNVLQNNSRILSGREFGFGGGLGRRGSSFFWLSSPRVSTGDAIGYSDGSGGDSRGGNGRGGQGGGGGGGGYGDSGRGSDGESGDSDRILSFSQAGSALWLWYNTFLQTYPIVSKSLTAGILNAVADLICQVYIEKAKTIDWKRFFSFVSIGVFCTGPGLHFWYGALPNIITVPGAAGVFLRIALDQLVFTPLGLLNFYVILLVLEDRRHELRSKLEKDFWPTVFANWKVWIPFQILNFGLIPSQLQVPAAGLLGMLWSIFISNKSHT